MGRRSRGKFNPFTRGNSIALTRAKEYTAHAGKNKSLTQVKENRSRDKSKALK